MSDLQETHPYLYHPLVDISPDGTKATFVQLETHTYNIAYTLGIIATPTTPPREIFDDYEYIPE